MKRRYTRWLLVAAMAVMLAGCGNKETSVPNEGQKTEDLKDKEEDREEQKTEEQQGEADTKEDTEKEPESRSVTLYYIDEQSGAYADKQIQVTEPEDIWKELQKTPILTEECQMLSCEVDEKAGRMHLDFNRATGERIRSMGTTGEQEILACIVNSYLEAYGCSEILLTEESKALSTSHGASLDGYMQKIELQ